MFNGDVNVSVSDQLISADKYTHCANSANNESFKHMQSATSIAAVSYYIRAVTVPDWNKLSEKTVICPSVYAFNSV